MAKETPVILICDCDGTMRLDGKALTKSLDGLDVQPYTNLCRSQLDAYSKAVAGEVPVVVGCTQEVPVFLEILDEHDTPAQTSFVNIRERAGWSDEGAKATAKIAALIAESRVPVEPAKSLVLSSDGRVLILGDGDTPLEAAKRLSDILDVTVVFEDISGKGGMPLRLTDFPVFSGTVEKASGYFGNFDICFASLSASQPSSKNGYSFGPPERSVMKKTDLILDLRGGDPLFNAPEKRDGYFNPALNDPLAIERALFELAGLVGEFEKTRYVNYDASLCAHARNGIVGCTVCIDLCPAGAIRPTDGQVSFDPSICGGCGHCAGSCPTGAAEYAMPGAIDVLARLRVLLTTYRKAGGEAAVVLLHDNAFGDELINVMARTGRGLPANVLPFVVNEVSQAGLDFHLAALAYGASQVQVLSSPHKRNEREGLDNQMALANSILAGLGYGEGRVELIDEHDPDIVEARLFDLSPSAAVGTASFMALGKKRQRLNQILESLHGQSAQPVDLLILEAGAPFGAVTIDAENCTLCLSCVNACPANALRDNPDAPELKFQEDQCIQCGLCKATCPEKVISLTPQINFKKLNASALILKQEQPFECVRCGTPFGVGSTIERMIEKMKVHPMFQNPKALDRLRMCDDCRIVDMAEGEDHPWASKQRSTRSTDDYLKERDELRRLAAEKKPKT